MYQTFNQWNLPRRMYAPASSILNVIKSRYSQAAFFGCWWQHLIIGNFMAHKSLHHHQTLHFLQTEWDKSGWITKIGLRGSLSSRSSSIRFEQLSRLSYFLGKWLNKIHSSKNNALVITDSKIVKDRITKLSFTLSTFHSRTTRI